MKKSLLVLAMSLLSLSGFSQYYMYVDSVKVLPVNPTSLDSVYLHVYWHCPWGVMSDPPIVNHAGFNHSVYLCHYVMWTTQYMMEHDSVFLFQGPSGMHTVTWTVMQNATNNSACDMQVGAGQEQVNVIATDIADAAGQPGLEIVEQNFQCNSEGTFRLYSTTGQLLYETVVTRGKRIAIRATAGQMYFATLTTTEGKVTTLKFVMGE